MKNIMRLNKSVKRGGRKYVKRLGRKSVKGGGPNNKNKNKPKKKKKKMGMTKKAALAALVAATSMYSPQPADAAAYAAPYDGHRFHATEQIGGPRLDSYTQEWHRRKGTTAMTTKSSIVPKVSPGPRGMYRPNGLPGSIPFKVTQSTNVKGRRQTNALEKKTGKKIVRYQKGK